MQPILIYRIYGTQPTLQNEICFKIVNWITVQMRKYLRWRCCWKLMEVGYNTYLKSSFSSAHVCISSWIKVFEKCKAYTHYNKLITIINNSIMVVVLSAILQYYLYNTIHNIAQMTNRWLHQGKMILSPYWFSTTFFVMFRQIWGHFQYIL